MFTTQIKHSTNTKSNHLSPFQKRNDGNAFFQPKLNIGKPGDKYETEADKVADKIVANGENQSCGASFFAPPTIQRLPDNALNEQMDNEEIREETLTGLSPSLIQSMEIPEEENVQTKCADCVEEEQNVQMKSGTGAEVDPSVENILNSSRSDGSVMGAEVRSEMENGFGADFSKVRIHTDSNAVQMSKDMGAQAFTQGNDVYFNDGKYNPVSNEGKHLLAHELTHTIQQQGAKTTINKYPHQGCEDGDVIDNAQTVVWFEHDSTNLRTDGEVNSITHFLLLWREVSNYLDMVGTDGIVFIHGYASEEGGDAHNLTLSLQRAIRIKSLLATMGIPEAQMVPIAHGESADYEERAYNRRVEVTYYPTATCMVFDPLPITGSIKVMDCSDGRNINNNGDHDLDKLIHRPGDRSPDIWVYDNLLGESGAYSDFYIGFFAGTFGVDTSDDNRLFNNFTAGSGGQIDFSTGSDMAREIGGTDAFTTFADEFEESVRVYFDEHDTLHGFDCEAELIRTRPNYIGGSDSLFSWAVMGGYQRLETHIDLSAGQINITYRVFDHYGAGVSDSWSYLPGLSAMYYLQHYVTGSSSTYVPFIWSVHVNRINAL